MRGEEEHDFPPMYLYGALYLVPQTVPLNGARQEYPLAGTPKDDT